MVGHGSSGRCVPSTASCSQKPPSELSRVAPAASARLHPPLGWRVGWGDESSDIRGSALPHGFSLKEFSPLSLESFFQPFRHLLSEDSTAL